MGKPLYRVERDEHGWVVHISDEVAAEELAEALDSLTVRTIRKGSRLTAEGAEMREREVKRAARGRARNLVETTTREEAPKPRRRFGAMKGKLDVPDGIFDPLPREELDAWQQ